MDINWQQFIFAPHNQLIQAFEQFCHKRFQDPALADQAFLFALDAIQHNDWAKLRRFQGRSTAKTFVYAVFRNAVEDFAVKQFGKFHIPVWVQKMGALWQQVYKRLCRERQPAEAICNSLGQDQAMRLEILHITRKIRQQEPQCGASKDAQFESIEAHNVEHISDEGLAYQSPEQVEAILQQQKLISALSQLLSAPSPVTALQNDDVMQQILQQLERLQFTPQQKLILKLHFQHNKSISEIARLLTLPDHTCRRQLQKMLKQLSNALKPFNL